jgi:hypothetical protein
MNTKTIHKVLIAVLMIGATSSVMAEGSVTSGGFGDSKLTQVSPVKKKSGECVSFEATFSEPLDKKPSAVLDIERYFVNMLNAAALEVTKDPTDKTGKKYRMALTATTTEACPKIEDDARLTISTTDEHQTIPQSVTFKADKQANLRRQP